MSIGKRIAEERKRLELTQAEFAKKAGVSLSTQKRFEANERAPSIHYIGDIAKAGVNIGYVMTGSNSALDQLSFYTHFDKNVFESLAITALDLDMENFSDTVSAIKTDNIKELLDGVLDALIENSPPLLDRLKAERKKAADT